MWRILATRSTEDAKYQGQMSHGVQWKIVIWWIIGSWHSSTNDVRQTNGIRCLNDSQSYAGSIYSKKT